MKRKSKKYHSKIDFVEEHYSTELRQANRKSKVVCIIKAVENTRTFANKEFKTQQGKMFTKMYSCCKFVSQYYVYIKDEELGLCSLKISSYLPFPCEFSMNGHNYLRQHFDIQGMHYKMKDNSFVEESDVGALESLVKDFQPSLALKRIDYWMQKLFRFDKGNKSTRSKLLTHQWFTYQTEVSFNVIFKSAKFLNSYFHRILHKHLTIPINRDRLTGIFGLSSYLNTLCDIDLSSISTEMYDKYQQTIIMANGQRVPAPDLRKQNQLALIAILISSNYHELGFRNKDLRSKFGDSPKTAKIA